ncbi:hypothetical protein IJM86_03820 [bacterium]|nr:hypothetical protein [bacterium]
MIYGEAIGFDTILWNLRNIVKNLSNFGLGFLFVYQIFTYIFSQGGDVKSKLPEQIKKCFIAGVLIQISWFLMATLIDISTIATYGVGGLPLTLEKDVIDSTKDSQKQRYTYGFFMDMDLSKADPYNLYYKTKKHYIPPCYTDSELQGITFSGNLVLTGGESPISLTGAVIDFIVGIKDNLNTGLNLPLLT